MPRLPWCGGIALGILSSLSSAGCGFGDLFRAPGPAPGVYFVFGPDTVVDRGATVPLRVAVLADGDTVRNPRFEIRSLDTTRFILTAANDSIIGVRQGTADLEVRLIASIATGRAPDTLQRIRVRP